jgi:hypothetical protein
LEWFALIPIFSASELAAMQICDGFQLALPSFVSPLSAVENQYI